MPCMPVTHGEEKKDEPGLCKGNKCTPLRDLMDIVRPCLHPSSLRQCEDKDHETKDVLLSCYHYCKKEGKWFYGYYKSNENSLCLLENPSAPGQKGYCCNGHCVSHKSCPSTNERAFVPATSATNA
uniref:Uncharacterized protein n=1 Tax=Amblyomma maculatum TaxID=34609 RepID=G3MTU8_AMBMU